MREWKVGFRDRGHGRGNYGVLDETEAVVAEVKTGLLADAALLAGAPRLRRGCKMAIEAGGLPDDVLRFLREAVALAKTQTDEIDEDTLRIGLVHGVEQAKAMCQALSGHLPLPGERCIVAVGVEPYEHGRYRTYLENTSPAGTPASSAAFRVLTETDGKILIGEVASFTVPGGLAVEARVDTGAQTSSIYADNIETFKRGGKKWVRFSVRGDRARFERRIERTALVKCPGGGNERRPVVLLEITLCGVRVEREFTLADRSQFEFKALLGRNTLSGIAVVDVAPISVQA